jgi:hypothetical protein
LAQKVKNLALSVNNLMPTLSTFVPSNLFIKKQHDMLPLRAIGIGILIWILGVSLFILSFFIPLLEDPDLQANIFLSVGIIPLAWFGSKLYYRNNNVTKGYWLGLAFFTIAGLLDAIITVPVLMAPYGGTHYSFFTALGFWLIGLEFVATATLYWYMNVYDRRTIVSNL